MDGDRLPVSVFMDHADGQFELGASAYEKRGVAVSVPAWDAEKCIQCNNCSFVCPHATIRPFALGAEEAAAAPDAIKLAVARGPKAKAAGYQFTMAVSPLDCMGCTLCVGACPADALTMVATDSAARPAGTCSTTAWLRSPPSPSSRAPRSRTASSSSPTSSSPDRAPAAPRRRTRAWSPSCSATACTWPTPRAAPRSGATPPRPRPTAPTRTAAARRGTTRCSRTTPSTAWACCIGHEAVREALVEKTARLLASEGVNMVLRHAAREWMATRHDGEANRAAADAYIAALEHAVSDDVEAPEVDAARCGDPRAQGLPGQEERLDLRRRRLGVRHRLRRSRPRAGERQATSTCSCSTPRSTPTPAARPPRRPTSARWRSSPPPARTSRRRASSEIAMSYGYVYVAQVAMGAKPAQTIKAITEAEAYHGPSLIIGYSPLRDALHQGRHEELPARDEARRGLRLLEPVPLQPGGRAGQEVRPRLQGAGRRLPGVPHERGALQPPDARVPRACRRAVRDATRPPPWIATSTCCKLRDVYDA